MDNPALDSDFDLTRNRSAYPYGDEGEGYNGAEQRRQLERKYIIARRPAAEVDHPGNRHEFIAAVQVYRPGLTDAEALDYLLDSTAYPFDDISWIRSELRADWFAALDKKPYLGQVAKHFPGLTDPELTIKLKRSGFTPATEDLDGILAQMARDEAAEAERLAQVRARVAAQNREKNLQWEDSRAEREARRKAARIRIAGERVERAEAELARATARFKDLESDAAAE